MKNFPKMMRSLGAAALVASGVTFMLEGLNSMTSAGKFTAFLGFISALAAAGIFCSRVIRENKGARTFLGLATAAITAQASQLGAMIYALFNPLKTAMPGIFVFEAIQLSTIALLGGVSLALLAPVAGLGFGSLNRPQARRATGLFLALNALLLAPSRNDFTILALFAAGAALYGVVERRFFRDDPVMSSPEGWIMRAILVTPLLTLVGRQAFYPMSPAALGVVEIALAAGLFVSARGRIFSLSFAKLMQAMSVPLLAVGWWNVVSALPWDCLLYWIPFSWMLIGASYFAVSDGRGYRNLGAIVSLLAAAFSLFTAPTFMGASVLVLNGMVLMLVATEVHELGCLHSGMLSFALGVGYTFVTALRHCAWNNWIGLAVIGAVVLILSSYIERHRERLVAVYTSYLARTAGWK